MAAADQNLPMERREFVGLLAQILGGLGIAGMAEASGSETIPRAALDDSYLEAGLTGMARSKGWFEAHWGAAVLAGYYLCKENPLAPETVAAVQSQLDAMIRLRADQFAPFPKFDTDLSLIAEIPASLRPALAGGLRAHGHAVIFTTLSLRALQDVPHLAGSPIIDAIRSHNREIARKAPVPPRTKWDYPNGQAMVEALFDNLARFEPLLGRPTLRRPNFTHMTTHTEALLTLEAMGYADLAKAGQAGQQAHLEVPLPEFDSNEHPLVPAPVTLAQVMSPKYWESPQQQEQWNKAWNETSNPNGYWVAFGHLFKLLYSYHRLAGRIQDKEKCRLCSEILLQRYVDPQIHGG